jgi:hypothetical protein
MFREDALTIPAVLQKAEELAMAEIWNVPVDNPPLPESVAVPEVVVKPEKPSRKKIQEQPAEFTTVTPELEAPVPQVESVAETPAVTEEKPVTKPKTTRKKTANPPAEQMTMF